MIQNDKAAANGFSPGNVLPGYGDRLLPNEGSHKVYWSNRRSRAAEVKMNNQQPPETLKIVIEEVTDTYRVFNTNYELTALPGLQISRHEPPEAEGWSPLAMEAVQIPGVETVVLRPYALGIHKAVAFEWDAISPAVKQLLLWVGNTFVTQPLPQAKQEKMAGKVVPVEA